MSAIRPENRLRTFVVIAFVVLLSACTGGMGDLEEYVVEVKKRPGGRIEPLPEIKTYEGFEYSATDIRSPFIPDEGLVAAQRGGRPGAGPQPDFDRNREFLEQFPLDTLRMVGTIELTGQLYGLIRANDGLIHRVQSGNYVGQNHGKITLVNDAEIDVVEIIPDGLGGWMERPAAIALSE